MDAVGADDDLRCHLAVQHDPVVAHLDPAHPPLLQHRPGRHRVLHEARVEDLARYDVHLAPHRTGNPRVAAGQLEVTQRRPTPHHVGGSHARERVEHVWRDAVAAALVAREVGPVEQQHPQ